MVLPQLHGLMALQVAAGMQEALETLELQGPAAILDLLETHHLA
jgi:hypothetical protein